MIRSVAIVGTGAMGAPIARRLLAAGLEVTVCDRRRELLADLAAGGAHVAATPAQCARAELILILVANAAQVRDVLLGEQGLATALAAGAAPLVAVMSTVSPASLQALAADLAPRPLRLIDAPVSGGALRAGRGTLTVMAGGEAADIAAVRPVFAAFASSVFHCGALSTGQTMKIINNMIGIAVAPIAAEAYALAQAQGLELAQVSRVLDASTGRNFLSEDSAGPAAAFASMTPDSAGFASLLEVMRKDLALAVDLAGRQPACWPALAAVQSLVDALDDDTLARWRRLAEAR